MFDEHENDDQEHGKNKYWFSSTITGMNFDDCETENVSEIHSTAAGSDIFFNDPNDPHKGLDTLYESAALLAPSVISESSADFKACIKCNKRLLVDHRFYMMGLCYCSTCYGEKKAGANIFNNELEKSNKEVFSMLCGVLQGNKQLLLCLGDMFYRTIAGKRSLLFEACRLGAGDIIISVVLFLRSTLCSFVFKEELTRSELKGRALVHYLAYLRHINELEMYKDARLSYFTLLPSSADAVPILNLQRIFLSTDENVLITALTRFIQSETAASDGLRAQVDYYIRLLIHEQDLTNRLKKKPPAIGARYANISASQLQQQQLTFPNLSLMDFLYQLLLNQPVLEQLDTGLTDKSIKACSATSDQVLWARISALCTQMRRAGGGPQFDKCAEMLESCLLEKSGVFMRTTKLALTWPVDRQRRYLQHIGVPPPLLLKLNPSK